MNSCSAYIPMGPICPIDGFAAPGGMQEPPPGFRLNHVPDPEVHEAYRESVHDLHRRS